MFLRVHVSPGSRKESVIEEGEGVLQISVREPASGNAANTRVRELIALRLGCTPAQVRILTGHHSGSKMISINTEA